MIEQHEQQVQTVFLYLRKSTDEKSERQIRSIDDQRADCMRVAERFGLNVVEEFVENRSAWKPNERPVFKELLRQLSFKDPRRRRAE